MKRALLVGSVTALEAGCATHRAVPSIEGEHAPPPPAPSAHEPAPPAEAPAQRPPYDHWLLPSDGPPLLHTDTPRVASTEEAAPFPCAVHALEEAEQIALNADDAARQRFELTRLRAQYDLLGRDIVPAQDLDYLALERVMPAGSVHIAGDLFIDRERLLETGVRCGGAHERAVCLAKLADVRAQTEATLPCDTEHCEPFERVIAYSIRGDEVRAHAGKAELRALLGDIDTPVEAMLMVVADQKPMAFLCDDAERFTHRRVGSAHELVTRAWTSSCRPLKEEVLTYRVDRTGRVRVVRRRIASLDRQRCVVSGRRPRGLVASRREPSGSARALLARMAYLEAASIPAFAQLASALAAHGADDTLLARIECARCDEVRHARLVGRLARRLGARVERPRIAPHARTSLLALAVENAVEGCVRELYGALVAGVQAERARDPELRAVFRQLAHDEAEHAALAWEVAAFLDTRLGEGERAQVRAARSVAHATLASSLAEPSEEERSVCGLPSLREARQLVGDLGGFLARAQAA